MPRPTRKLPEDDRTIILYSQKMPAGTLRQLRELAAKDHRTVTDEVIWLVESAYRDSPPAAWHARQNASQSRRDL